MTIILTTAQRSALECAGLDMAETATERILADAWRGTRLVVTNETRDALFEAVNDRSNAEDAQAIEQRDVYARRAARALENLASKILRGN